MAHITIVEQTNDPSLAWCDILIDCIDILDLVCAVSVEINQDTRRHTLHARLVGSYEQSSEKSIKRICKLFVESNRSTFISLKVEPLEIILVFEKRDRAKLLGKENPLNDRKYR
jgi:hypothetical protein